MCLGRANTKDRLNSHLRMGCNTCSWLYRAKASISGKKDRRGSGCWRFVTILLTEWEGRWVLLLSISDILRSMKRMLYYCNFPIDHEHHCRCAVNRRNARQVINISIFKKEGKRVMCTYPILPGFISLVWTIFLHLGNVDFLFFICHPIERYIGYVEYSFSLVRKKR